MAKDESTIIKGVAILLMIFLHLFCKENMSGMYYSFFHIGHLPLVNILSRAAGPVPFFIILSGYGITYIYNQGRFNLKRQTKKILKLYILFWLTLLIFIPIGHSLRPDDYPGSFVKFIENISGYNTSYNSETWFLFPYVVLTICAPAILKFIDRFGNKWALTLFFFITYASNYCFSRFLVPHALQGSAIGHVLVVTGFTFGFAIGAVMCRLAAKNQLKRLFLMDNNSLTLLVLVLLISAKCLTTSHAFDYPYTFAFIYLFIHLKLPQFLKIALLKFGKASTSMWMIHSYFCYHLFQPYIYWFKYPIIIFFALISISYLCAIPIQKMANFIYNRLKL